MGAKPKTTGSAAKVPAKKKRPPARRVPARKAASKAGRTAREKTVEAYVAGLDSELAAAARRLRELILSAAPSATESIKWGQPVYEDNGPFCFIKASADHITLGFWRGTEIEDRDGRLEGGSESPPWAARSESDDGEYGEAAEEIEPAQIESVQSIETTVEPGSDRFQDDDSF